MTRNPPAGKKQKEKKVTVRTIAEMTGYAHCTVARALADRGNVAEETRRRIVRIAMESGYVNKSEPVVALILPPFGREISTYNTSLIDELVRHLDREGCRYELIPESMVGKLNEKLLNGAISLCYLGTLEKQWASLYTIPLVCINDYGFHLNRIYSVSSNDRQVMSLLVEHLLAGGRKRVVYYELHSSTKNQRERKAFFLQKAEEAEIEIVPLPERDRNWGEFVRSARIDAVIIPAEDPDLRIYAQIREQGLRIPDDVELIHWFSRKITDVLMPGQFSPGQDFPELARQAVLLMKRLFRGDEAVHDLFVDHRIFQSGTLSSGAEGKPSSLPRVRVRRSGRARQGRGSRSSVSGSDFRRFRRASFLFSGFFRNFSLPGVPAERI